MSARVGPWPGAWGSTGFAAGFVVAGVAGFWLPDCASAGRLAIRHNAAASGSRTYGEAAGVVMAFRRVWKTSVAERTPGNGARWSVAARGARRRRGGLG